MKYANKSYIFYGYVFIFMYKEEQSGEKDVYISKPLQVYHAWYLNWHTWLYNVLNWSKLNPFDVDEESPESVHHSSAKVDSVKPPPSWNHSSAWSA